MLKIKKKYKHGEIIDHTSFRPLIPKDIYDLLVEVSREGFSLTLVGGAVRDWIRTGNLPHDLDFELRHTFEYDEKDWSFRVNRLGERLREIYRYKVEFLSFSILRITWDGSPYEVELGPSRFEVYKGEGPFGHSDFIASLVSSAPYSETFKRRDFTFNALGIEFRSPMTEDEFAFIDPYEGLEDFHRAELDPCSENCHKDPVRFCRALRFSHNLNLTYSEKMLAEFSKFDLSKLSLFYFFREAFKSDFFSFTREFFEKVEEYKIILSSEIKELSFLGKIGTSNLQLRSAGDVLMYLIYKEGLPLNPEDLLHFIRAAKLKDSSLSTHQNFRRTLENLDLLNTEEWENKFTELHGLEGFEEFLTENLLSDLRSFHQVVSRHGKENFAVLGRIHGHLYATFLKTYEILPAVLEGKDLFENFIKEFSGDPSKRGDLQYYAHFIRRSQRLKGDGN